MLELLARLDENDGQMMGDAAEEMEMEKFPYSRVVITGGCGYVGRQVANALREAYPTTEIVLFDFQGPIQ